ncbi:MAG: TlpA family protein disulfide reductase [Candidatus Koribacter versatilis]|uniref:TlpA family protein disulfide reductase n=1 Tax=Candidatus Korobacter versatilis TaxID=658062 RepID=A0A932A7H9_9BACT|nr:TlpA family protein disulfide reductase [Candidatus Koribacter versatilis]
MFALARPIRVVLAVALLFAGTLPSVASDEDNERAPNFRARTMDGQSFNNASVKGKVVLLQFWTTWCPVCKSEEHLLDAIDKEFAPRGLIVLAIDVGEGKKTVKKYLQEHPRTVRIVLNDDTNLAAMYAADAYPVYVVIDREGNIAATQRGGGGEGALRGLLASAGLETDYQSKP